jgi:hypothetical protein
VRTAHALANRKVTWLHDTDGMLVIKAIEAACEEIPAAEISAETPNVKFRPDPSARKADALAVVAESFLAQGAAALKGGDRHQIVIHVHAETLRESAAGRCHFAHGPGEPLSIPSSGGA